MMLGATPLACNPLVTAPAKPRPYKLAPFTGEFGYAAWSYSRQGKLNAWAWHGLGGYTLFAWASLGIYVYVRKEEDQFVHVMQPDVYLTDSEVSTDSQRVEAYTQWLDFGKPGRLKSLSGIDFDGINVERVEVYVSVDGNRQGELADVIEVGSNAGGWTYNGELLPVNAAGTEFKLRFICNARRDVQVNRLTLYWDDLAG